MTKTELQTNILNNVLHVISFSTATAVSAKLNQYTVHALYEKSDGVLEEVKIEAYVYNEGLAGEKAGVKNQYKRFVFPSIAAVESYLNNNFLFWQIKDFNLDTNFAVVEVIEYDGVSDKYDHKYVGVTVVNQTITHKTYNNVIA